LFAAGCLLCAAWLVFLVLGCKRWRECRYAARAAAALGATLGRLALQGHRALHDASLGEVSVDHVILGMRGVFAIKTVVRPPMQTAASVRINGRSIEFQDGFALLDTIAVAERGARILAELAARALGRRIHVHPVVAVPGWEIGAPQGQVGQTFLINEKTAVLLLQYSAPADHLLDDDAGKLQEQLARLCIDRKL